MSIYVLLFSFNKTPVYAFSHFQTNHRLTTVGCKLGQLWASGLASSFTTCFIILHNSGVTQHAHRSVLCISMHKRPGGKIKNQKSDKVCFFQSSQSWKRVKPKVTTLQPTNCPVQTWTERKYADRGSP